MAAPASRIGVIRGQFTRPGINGNRRLYTSKMISDGVTDMQSRIDSGEGLPVRIFTSHEARDRDKDAFSMVAKPTKVWQESDGSGWYEANLFDTTKARDLAGILAGGEMVDVSMAGDWIGEPRVLFDDNGQPYTTADGIRYKGWDIVTDPATPGSRVTSVVFDEMSSPSDGNQTPPLSFRDSVEGGITFVTESDSAIADHQPQETAPMAETAPAPTAPEAPSATPAPVVTLPVADFKSMLADAMASGAKAAADAVKDALTTVPTPVVTATLSTLEPAAPAPAAAPVTATPAVADSEASPSPEAIAAAKEQLRKELADQGVMPNRKGVVSDATVAEKPLHELSDGELKERSAALYDEALAPFFAAKGVTSARDRR